jgi:DNA mismatch repair protein MutL
MAIKILDSKVVSQIAAGEVVERPASVVKELVENSLDAGSSQISIEVKGGGIILIRVTDNGTGIIDGEAEVAFARHATSKISSLQDLQHISSLGFRGEALPSIASAAQVQMITCARGEASGTYLSLDDGKVVHHESQARSPGTTLTVQNLFRKIPARLKFLKSESAEGGRIADIVSHYALAYPEVRFTLIAEGKTTLQTPGNGKLLDSVLAVYGLEVAQNMLEVKSLEEKLDSGRAPIIITGLVGSPRISRSTRDHISLFVNRRWVNNRMLGFAIEEAYHGLLMQGKHPIVVINIEISPSQIDVNVHPAKTEIKFQDERSVFGAVQKAVRQTLVQSTPVPHVEELKQRFTVPLAPYTKSATLPILKNPEPTTSEAPVPAITPLISLPLLRVLGQLARKYIIAEGPDGLYLIDQHAAHERIQFEKIRKQRENHKVEVQGLLEPATFEVEPRLASVFGAHQIELSSFGFNIEPFGERTYLVRTIPALLGDKNWMDTLRESLGALTGDWAENLAITVACHSAIRGGQILSDAEMRELVKQLEQADLPHSCPHGRPTMIQLPYHQIEREFGRVQ